MRAILYAFNAATCLAVVPVSCGYFKSMFSLCSP